MKKLRIYALIFSCFFSSPNCGVLFASTPSSTFVGSGFYTHNPKQELPALETAKGAGLQIPKMQAKLKKARLLKRALFVVDLREPISFSLLVFSLAFFLFSKVASRKPAQLFLRSPPQLQS